MRKCLTGILGVLGFLTVGSMVFGFQGSAIKSDEHVVFFVTSASLSSDGETWQLPIPGWIHEPEDSTVRLGIDSAALKAKFDLEPTEANSERYSRRLTLFLVDNERGKKIKIRVGQREVLLPKSEANGHFKGAISMPVEEVEKISVDGVVPFSAVLPSDDKPSFTGRVLLVPPKGVSVISDIDDTVKISEVID